MTEDWYIRIEEKIDGLRDEQKLTKELLNGNGEPEKGLILKVDRLIQAEDSRRWWTRTALGAALGAAATSVWSVMSGK